MTPPSTTRSFPRLTPTTLPGALVAHRRLSRASGSTTRSRDGMTLSPLSALGLATTRPNAITLALCVVLLSSGHSALAQFSGESALRRPGRGLRSGWRSRTRSIFFLRRRLPKSTGTALSCFHAPIYLPNSFRIGELVVHAYDSSANDDLTVELNRVELDSFGNAHTEILANVSSSGNSGIQPLTRPFTLQPHRV